MAQPLTIGNAGDFVKGVDAILSTEVLAAARRRELTQMPGPGRHSALDMEEFFDDRLWTLMQDADHVRAALAERFTLYDSPDGHEYGSAVGKWMPFLIPEYGFAVHVGHWMPFLIRHTEAQLARARGERLPLDRKLYNSLLDGDVPVVAYSAPAQFSGNLYFGDLGGRTTIVSSDRGLEGLRSFARILDYRPPVSERRVA